MNAVKLALALQYVRNRYSSPADVDGHYTASVWLVDPGTVISDNAETRDPTVPYTDDDEVTLRYPDGSVYVLSIERIR